MDTNYYYIALAFLIIATFWVTFSRTRQRIWLYPERKYQVVFTSGVYRGNHWCKGKSLRTTVTGSVVEGQELWHVSLGALGTVKSIELLSNKRTKVTTSTQEFIIVGGRQPTGSK